MNCFDITVPWNAGPDAIVTASMAIYPRDGGKKCIIRCNWLSVAHGRFISTLYRYHINY